MTAFIKQRSDAPSGFFALEAAGLRWLSAVDGGVPCAAVRRVTRSSLELERLATAHPSPTAAAEFGRRLATMHDAGAPAFGVGPPEWKGDGFFGPLQQPLPMTLQPFDRWGAFYARARLGPVLDLAERRGLDEAGRGMFESVLRRCEAGDFDDPDTPARLHGDLWSGNVMWTPDGVVLIDPAAHAGHRETDLAMLQLFGLPYLDDVIDAYQSVHPLHPGWTERVGLHQLYPLLVHAVLFGGGYLQQALHTAREYA